MRTAKESQMIQDNATGWISQLLLAGVLGSALIFGAGAAWADGDNHGYKHDPQSQLEKLTKKLDLTQEQQNKILPILQDKHEKMEALHNQMKEMRQNAMSQIEAQLTPEQKEKFQKSREERKEKMKEYKKKHGKGHEKGRHGKGKHGKSEDHD
jgi:Spy/CpxP family protein refolding chaperone